MVSSSQFAYGGHSCPIYRYTDDNFLCNTCNAKKVTPPAFDKNAQHVYTHPVVHCKPRVEDPPKDATLTADQRIEALEKGVAGLESSMSERFAHVDKMLATVQAAVQELLVVRSRAHVSNGTANHA